MFSVTQIFMPEGQESIFLAFVCSVNTSPGSERHLAPAGRRGEGDAPPQNSPLVGKAAWCRRGADPGRESPPHQHGGQHSHGGRRE